MPKQNKRDKRVIVNGIYFDMLRKKAILFDEITSDANGDPSGIHAEAGTLKDVERLKKEWERQDIDDLDHATEPYIEPKA